jgi:predicted RNA-binding Zn-ribbon protein involved in translation (DUF1610 family)
MARKKYHNIKTEVNGKIFDSRAESRRYEQLLAMERAHLISNLICQPKFPLEKAFKKCPKCRIEIQKTKRGQAKICPVCGSQLLVFQARHYIADFQYLDKDGNLVIEDVKGFNLGKTHSHGTMTPFFRYKWQRFEELYPELTLTIVAMPPEPKKPKKKAAYIVQSEAIRRVKA